MDSQLVGSVPDFYGNNGLSIFIDGNTLAVGRFAVNGNRFTTAGDSGDKGIGCGNTINIIGVDVVRKNEIIHIHRQTVKGQAILAIGSGVDHYLATQLTKLNDGGLFTLAIQRPGNRGVLDFQNLVVFIQQRRYQSGGGLRLETVVSQNHRGRGGVIIGLNHVQCGLLARTGIR